jgi:hypothetical protein
MQRACPAGLHRAKESKVLVAQREAAEAAAQLRNANHYTPWINLGCLYSALAENVQPENRTALQDTAMVMLTNAMFQAQRAGAAPEAARSIRGDTALRSLQDRADFRHLVSEPQSQQP